MVAYFDTAGERLLINSFDQRLQVSSLPEVGEAFECPECGHSPLSLAPAVWQENTSESTNGLVIHSDEARYVAPPVEPERLSLSLNLLPTLLSLVGLTLLGLVAVAESETELEEQLMTGSTLIALAFGFGYAFVLMRSRSVARRVAENWVKEKSRYATEYQRWTSSWLCCSCSRLWIDGKFNASNMAQ